MKEVQEIVGWFVLRAAIYDFLRSIFILGPKPGVLTALYRIPANPYTQTLSESLLKYDVAGDDLLVEHTQIFTNPATMTAVPYASYYLSPSKLLASEVTISLRKLYAELGYTLQDKTLLEDHVGVELEVMYRLAAKTLDTLKEGKEKELEELIRKQLYFIKDHMLKWIPQFCSDIKKGASKDSFYYKLAIMLETFLADDAKMLELVLSEE